jgi:lipid-binding SYLF domain-containing protein
MTTALIAARWSNWKHNATNEETKMRAVFVMMTLLMGGASASASAATAAAENARMNEAARVVDASRSAPDNRIPDEIWRKAQCVAVIPGVKKGAFIVGGEYGSGVVSCRTAHRWGAPAFVTLKKASWGAQIGVESIDLVLLFMNQNGVDRLLADHVTLGTDASIAAGPLGRNGGAATDARLTAEMLSYSHAKGVFVGVDLAGGVVLADDRADEDLYGRNVTAREILLDGHVKTPAAARPLVAALNRTAADLAGR